MKKIVCLFSLVICFALGFAQGRMDEVVYLKNGSVIRGMIVEYVPNVSIKIKSGENLFVYKLDEIEKITREEPKDGSSAGNFGFRPRGYVGIVEVGLTDFPKASLPMATINIINGFQINPYVFAGLGIGADISSKGIYNVPIFLDTRFNFTKTRVSPFLELPIGYNLWLQKYSDPYYGTSTLSHFNGMVFNPALGLRVAINKKCAASLSLGYKLLGVNTVVTTYSYYGGSQTTNAFGLTHGITVKAGFYF